MMKWQKLVDYSCPSLSRGGILKFPASYPFEGEVAMMICEGLGSPNSSCLITLTGYKAGINCYQMFPDECTNDEGFLDVKWLIKNWNKWVWPEGNVNEVMVCEGLDVSDLSP